MLKSGQKRPTTPNKTRSAIGSPESADHWRQGVRETVLTARPDGSLNFSIHGGSDNGEFAYVSDIVQNKVNYVSGNLNEGDVVLEIQGQKVAGYTQRDVVAWLNHCCRNGNPVTLKTIDAASITKDLRQFLNTRFQKGSVDHDLQNTIRDNLYLRTVPVTTRVPRDGEVNGVDYTFLSAEEFMELERSGNLLESGIYEGNHYGTPKPSKEAPVSPPQSSGSNLNLNSVGVFGTLFPGAHPSSEGKRKRNRSNVEAMAAKNNMEPEPVAGNVLDGYNSSGDQVPTDPPSYYHSGEGPESLHADLGPLPPNWEKAYTDRGEVYFIDHNSGTSHWLDPRLSKFQKKSLEECLDDELPYGWEKIDDPHYGTYYIDHVNRRTQYENPVIQAKRAAQDSGVTGSSEVEDGSYSQYRKPQNSQSSRTSGNGHSSTSKRSNNFERAFFTRNPNELQGERITTTLIKSSRGLGFTIVGGDDTEEEFLQIKSVVPKGPAWLDGKLQTGDVLVYVNETCVLGFTHHDMVSVFQSIAPNETVTLEVCRGYPLPFDPNDPNTEVVTTVAVNAPDTFAVDASVYMDQDGNLKNEGYNFLDVSSDITHTHNGSEDLVNSSVKSVPDLCSSEKIKNIQRPSSTDVLLSDMSGDGVADFDENSTKPEYITIMIVKGAMGFGFTIADSAYGQKVKKILDRQRCKNLMEGDILVDINGINLRNMSHGEVVQVLKDCARNQEATVTVQRGGPGSPTKNKSRKKDDAVGNRKNVYKDTVGGMYRSKTPTAELYSTQQKEVIPNRPKTPLVDTRNRPKTPTDRRPWSPSETDGSAVDPSANNVDDSRFTNERKCDENGVDLSSSVQSPSSPLTPYLQENYKTAFPYPEHYDPRHEAARSPLTNLSDHLISTTLQESGSIRPGDYSRSRSPGNEIDVDQIQQREVWAKLHGHYDYKNSGDSYSENSPHSPGVFSSSVGDVQNDCSPSSDYLRHYVSHPYYNGYSGGQYDQGYSYGYGEVQTTSAYLQHKDFAYSQQMSGYSSQSHLIPGTSIHHPAFYTSDPANKRKESTSFEHEQPHPSNVTRYPRDLRWVGLGQGVRIYPAGPDMEWVETLVTLVRQETGFGFRIVGGTEEGSQVSIGHIVPGGAADLDGRLCTGDEIVSVDSQSVLSTSHHHVVQLMGKAAANGRVVLGIRRRIPSQDVAAHSRPEAGYPYDVTVTRRENEGFGFVIISSVNKAGSTIGRIIEGSPAERCGQLHVGDRILAVNHIDIMNMHHGDIVNLIKDSGYTVTLTIGPPVDDTSSTASVSQRDDDVLGGEDEQYHAVELSRGTRGFGFSIRGGREFQNMPLFVLQIAENGPAALDNRLKIGDQIIEINGINTKNMTHAEAIEIIRNGGPSVRLLVRRGGKVPPPPPVGEPSGGLGSGAAASPPSGCPPTHGQPAGLRPSSVLAQQQQPAQPASQPPSQQQQQQQQPQQQQNGGRNGDPVYWDHRYNQS
ncbi:membrane-associated guanylate kinase, WW and PDZ domain-containing protein 1 [Schistocerca americana]|uniref:membrane-associated guanylate kinase, WW and PDZ domain-containing protein 1 n=1 Tax=Schistocerca americana TaxID=7009 RepID=UPI001F4F2A88|nr:membrane-associated guanylate kinase, WW and PDZ domain-containing protein 1 [Schistocerca americana]XP_047104252.1 membrane-associated guanylate kinase, WW and PDZ domain-containing protein 1 isoform X1 [Schistocerca piceifrons]